LDTYQQVYYTEEPCGVCSWLSVPFLEKLSRDTILLHQLRDPIRTINSLINTHNYRSGPSPNMPFIRQHFRPQTEQPEVEFWFEWHRRIDKFCSFRYHIEDAPIREILERLRVKRSDQEVEHALSQVPTDFNSYGVVPQIIGWEDLPDRVRELTEKYGYLPKDLVHNKP
jgi:hypothetical protein